MQCLGAFAKLRKAASSFVISVCSSVYPHGTTLAPTGRIFVKCFCISLKFIEKIKFSLKSDKNNGYFTRRLIYIYDHISLTSSQNEKCFRQNLQRKSKHIMHDHFFFVYEIMWKNIAQSDRPQMTIQRMRIACWIPKATNTHSEQ